MGKYSLVVVNIEDKTEHVIPIYDSEKKEMAYKVHIKDIDAYTSKYMDLSQLVYDLNQKEIIDYNVTTCYVVSKYKNENLHYKTIFNSKLIEKTAQTVKSGHINPSLVDSYNEMARNFMLKLKDKEYLGLINSSIYFTNSNKNMLSRYSEVVNQLENYDNDSELLIEEQRLRLKILEEIKRYKTFRGLFLFEKEVQKFAYRKNTYSDSRQSDIRISNEQQYIDKSIGYRDVDLYNEEYDEFLSDEEYDNAYGSDEVVYKKGARHD